MDAYFGSTEHAAAAQHSFSVELDILATKLQMPSGASSISTTPSNSKALSMDFRQRGPAASNHVAASTKWISYASTAAEGLSARKLFDLRSSHPAVYQMALRYLGVAPTEVAVERLFSHAGRVISDQRTCAKEDLVNAQLMLKLYSPIKR